MLKVEGGERKAQITARHTALEVGRGICTGLLDLIYPPHCLVCGEAGDDYLCAECVESIIFIEPPYCRKCGIPCESFYCETCKEREFAFECACSVGLFEGVLRETIHVLKYDCSIVMAEPLANLMARSFVDTRLGPKIDVVIPVPIHRKRMLERGFNQSVELARLFCERLSLPLELGVLRKPRETRHQVDLPHDLRATNVAGAFSVCNGGNLAGRNVLLIDDVITTGSTLDEAARTLRASGAGSVYAYTLARSV
mgnify:CR=1 FL=1